MMRVKRFFTPVPGRSAGPVERGLREQSPCRRAWE